MPFLADPDTSVVLGELASTLAIYRAAIRARGYDGQSDEALNQVIQSARKDLLSKRRWSYALAQSRLLETQAGVDTFNVSIIPGLGAIDGIRYRSGTAEYDLDATDYQTLRDMQASDATTARGLPSHWARRGPEVVLYPTPEGAYELVVDYVKTDGPLAEGAEDFIPGMDHELVVWSAIISLAFRQREAWAMQYADQRFSALLRSALQRDAVQARSESDQVKPYWRSGDRYAR